MNGMEVKIEVHHGEEPSPAGRTDVEHKLYRVYAHSEAFADRNPEKRLQVGWIGTQAGANFMSTPECDNFSYAQQQWFASEAERLHGSAGTKAFVAPPPPLGTDTDSEEADEDDSE